MIQLVIFDLDGTLINAYPAVEQSVNRVLHHFGLQPQTSEVIKRAVGFGPQRLLETFLDGKKMKEALALYERIHTQALLTGSSLLPGAVELLHALKKRGCRLAVASNRPKRFSLIVIEHLGIASFFDRVLCGDELAQGKPHPEILQALMRERGAMPAETLYVGDMVIDVETGASAGVKTLVVPTGSHTEEELRAAGPWRVIQRLEEVLDFVE
ncbi:MAG TPA: HAD family hydrolase [Candidatus Bathyarchaeia archaeon]|nr:HAD family hydrolase [Candidatus Bathyarchaeia archaeon]